MNAGLKRQKIAKQEPLKIKSQETSGLWQLSDIVKTPKLILVGSPLRVNAVAAPLKTLGLDVVKVQFIKEMLENLDESVVGVVYVLPLERSHVLSVQKNIHKRRKLRRYDFFAVTPSWVTARTEREMYRLGIKMIFDWSKEQNTFEQLFSKALTVDLKKVGSKDSDVSLKKAIDNRIKVAADVDLNNLDLSVYHGIAMVRGEVKSLSERRKLIGYLRKVPGVRGVVDHSLRVRPSKEDFAKVLQRARRKLKESYGMDHHTLDVVYDSDQQAYVLKGVAKNQRALSAVVTSIEKVHGIDRLLNEATASPQRYRRDKSLARRALRAVKKFSLSSRVRVQVKVQQGRALLRGRVPSPMESAHLMETIASIDGIHAVDNRMQVDNSSRAS